MLPTTEDVQRVQAMLKEEEKKIVEMGDCKQMEPEESAT